WGLLWRVSCSSMRRWWPMSIRRNARRRSRPVPRRRSTRAMPARAGRSWRRPMAAAMAPAVSSVWNARSLSRRGAPPTGAATGGTTVVTGLFGGSYVRQIAMLTLKATAIEGAQTGTLAEARELLDLARERKLSPPPLAERPLAQAQAALDDLRAGRVVGRTVLTA